MKSQSFRPVQHRQDFLGQRTAAPVIDVVVSGGGVIGRAAALALGRLGYQVVLLAPGSVPSPLAANEFDARVYAINPAGRALLEQLQVWDALDAARVTPVRTMEVRAQPVTTSLAVGGSDPMILDAVPADAKSVLNVTDGAVGLLRHLASKSPLAPLSGLAAALLQRDPAQSSLLRFDAIDAHADALAWIIEDRHLMQALDGALKFTPSVRVVCQSFSRFAEGDTVGPAPGNASRAIVLDNGEVLHTRLLIGADGAQSQVRMAAGMSLAYKRYDQIATVANFSTELPHHDIAWQWFVPGQGIIALLPLPGQRVSLVWSAPESVSRALAADAPGELACRVAALTNAPLGDLQPLSNRAAAQFPLSLLRVPHPAAHRVLVIGDAAHVVHPLAGHGMNMGFDDIAELVRLLDTGQRHPDCGNEAVIQAYARRRKEPVLLMQAVTDGLTRLFHPDGGARHLLAGSGMAMVEKLPWLKKRLMAHALGRH